ncbi:uncharacterized protein B0H18DRAFT_953034 [Fomitopsis serialis]|uniref:uncharacterized protein n=1 Tax=Fomitopsis serialis TaxID=139415 RepID=UPI002007291B|nr:uncharacterized protein B0H18DRAFT_953034 [Neoantrodia serialis]KAH9930610.1 hypothetical protein B0H18DRAFT_953034 [Neoantrodia serialis]
MGDFDNGANWSGQQVGGAEGDVQRFDNSVNNAFDDGVQHVADAPDDAAHWAGDQAGDVAHGVTDVGRDIGDGVRDVENFGSGVDNSYDQGVQQGEQQGGW